MKKITIDGNEACSYTSYIFTESAGIYPITPSSPMAEHIDEWSSKGRRNIFNDTVKVVEMQSEAGAAGFVHGSLAAGILTSTYTASQGLLLMIPNFYKVAGEMLPLVVHVAARSLATHALSIFGDHQDIYAARSTGIMMLASSSVQDAALLSAVAHLSAIKMSLPIMHFFDGFRTSHEIDKINILNAEDYQDIIDYGAIEKFRRKALNPNNPDTRGTAQNDDVYFQATEVRNKYYNAAPDVVNYYMGEINRKAKTNYKPFNYYGSENAEHVIVAMGSVCETIKETIDALGEKYGLMEVHLYRPFSKEYFINELPSTVKSVAVLDRTKEPGSLGEPLYLDVKSILDIPVYGGRYGLSSKNTTPKDIKAVFNMLETSPFHNFTIGIEDDITSLSLKVDKTFKISSSKEFLIYGYGSDGMVSASKSIIKLIGENTDNYVQGYFQYDSKKSGGVTASHLRFDNKPIRSTYYVESPSLVVCTKDKYLDDFDLLSHIKENGTFILNTIKNEQELIIPEKTAKIIKERNIKFYTINAYEIAAKVGLGNKISTIMEAVIIQVSNIIDFNEAKDKMKALAKEKFGKKGDKIVQSNYDAIDLAGSYLKEVTNILTKENENYSSSVFEMITHRKGNELKTSDFEHMQDGRYIKGTSALEKRMISDVVPNWDKENCITCNLCSVVCPHGVIRPYLISEEEYKEMPEYLQNRCIKALDRNLADYYFTIGISVKDCTGCGLCIKSCPGRSGNKALTPFNLDEALKKKEQDAFDYLDSKITEKKVSKDLIKNTQFTKPKFAFSGACAGCGETPYIKLLTQVLGEGMIVANATGCSSIYGGSFPSTPYTIPWANSLFEDNAEFGYGILIANNIMRNRVREILSNNIEVDKELITKWLNNSNDYEITKEVYENIDYNKIPELIPYREYIPYRSVWTIGGDGWAYDIGYGGIDHVLASNDNVNILVLDTQVYSNTGGQSSKASPIGSIASFTNSGKKIAKKDLAHIALSYPHVYVATVSLGANQNQLLKAFNEASKYDGPSIIIAYAPCISHGIEGGLANSIDMEKLATSSGYFPIFRYNPETKLFSLDSKNVNFDLYDEFLSKQTRYSMLKKINPSKAEELLKENKQNAMERFEYYKSLEK
ncbi:MAG: pyruvate:ferredoxin (flavodoxin) oxidoreductase [Bacilli bacterium]|nr:pyruvate:ferredoxin (flavodoxin) oxidoreductase [Bacilli bacterium]